MDISRYTDRQPISTMPLCDLRDLFERSRTGATSVKINMKIRFVPEMEISLGIAGLRLARSGKGKVTTVTNIGQLRGWLAGIQYADQIWKGRPPYVSIMPTDTAGGYGWTCYWRDEYQDDINISSFDDLDGAAAFSDACAAVSAAAEFYGEDW